MTLRLQRLWRVVRHFATARGLEVSALQASPILGIFLGGYDVARDGLVVPCLLALGSFALTAHVFVFNDWAGYKYDLRDPLRAPLVFDGAGISRKEVAVAATVLFVIAAVLLAAVGAMALVIGAAIGGLGLLYSGSPVLGRSTPVASTLNHLAGGTLHFLLGYTLVHEIDTKGIATGVFFGLVFAAGHLNQEVRDYDGDLASGVRTNAVLLGRRHAFLASLCVFMTAYVLLTCLAVLGVVPRLLLWSPAAALLHLAWSLRALRRGLGFETAMWMQLRYRCLFALVGLAMMTG
jgi:4-hydroxybenzoate polyprenyltransferase